MDRSYEPPVPFEEHRANVRITDQNGVRRVWSMPVPVRVKHSGFLGLGVYAPPPLDRPRECFALQLRGTPSILTYPDGKHWLVTTLTLPDGSTPTDPFANEPPHNRVDGAGCKGYMTFSSAGKGYMINVDISRATLGGMTARVLESEPDSRILVRLLPRLARGAVRLWRPLGCLQFWTAI